MVTTFENGRKKVLFCGLHLISGKNDFNFRGRPFSCFGLHSISATEIHPFHFTFVKLVKAAKVSPNANFYNLSTAYQRWSRGHKARGQGQGHKKNPRPRPRTAFPRTDTLEAKDRNARDQGQGPRTQSASALQKNKKQKVFRKFFRRSPKKKKKFKRSPLKNVFQKIFQALHKILTFQKIVLSSSRGQANFRGLEASRPRPRTLKCVLEDVLEAKDVLEDSTSAAYNRTHLVPRSPVLSKTLNRSYTLIYCAIYLKQDGRNLDSKKKT